VASLALAGRNPLGIPSAHCDDSLRHQGVVDDHVRFIQQPLRSERQQVFRARTGADQGHMAGDMATVLQ